jgi:hypothetical protein
LENLFIIQRGSQEAGAGDVNFTMQKGLKLWWSQEFIKGMHKENVNLEEMKIY